MEREDIKADLKSAYSELKRLGTRLADTGRDWWQQRRTEMNQRYEHEQDERNRGENRSQEYWQRSRQAARGEEDQDNYGLSGRQSPYRNDERRYDMGSSGMRGQQGSHGYSEDYSAGASGRGGRQWDDDDEPWRYSQRSYQTGADAYSPRAADYSGGAYGMSSTGSGSRYTGSAYQGPYGEEYGYGQDEFRTRGQGSSYGQRSGSRSGYSEYGNAPYGQSASTQSNQQRYGGQQRHGERSGYDLSSQYGQSGYGYGQNRSDEMPMGMSGASGNYGRSGYGGEQSRSQGFGQGSSSRGSYGTQGRYQGRGPRNYTRSDERITEELNERLTDDPDIDASEINVRVSNGMVTLEGTVEDRWMKHRAEDIADSCSGVKDVTNSIRVASRNERGGEYAGSLGGTSEASDASSAGKTGRTGAESTTTKTPHH